MYVNMHLYLYRNAMQYTCLHATMINNVLGAKGVHEDMIQPRPIHM